jgi:hypothetical protein
MFIHFGLIDELLLVSLSLSFSPSDDLKFKFYVLKRASEQAFVTENCNKFLHELKTNINIPKPL